MNAWQKAYVADRATPPHERNASTRPFAVTRGARGGLHGWETETVSCVTREEADALLVSALSLRRTIDVRIEDWSTGRPVRVRFERKRPMVR